MLKIKRIYGKLEESEGCRILVDRLWPRGLSKEKAKIDYWLKEIAPSEELRKWFAHDPEKWSEFKHRYFEELDNKSELVEWICKKAQGGTVTLLYSTKEEQFNNAVALKEYIETLR
jgi:uncharacterized protein YeaO (DUF488 family)